MEVTLEEPGLFKRMVGVFFFPGKTFASINRQVGYKDWLVPLILAGVVAAASAVITGPISQKVGMEVVQKTLEENPNLTRSQKEQALENVEKRYGSLGASFQMVVAPVYIGVMVVVVSMIFLALVNFVLGGDATYKKVVTVLSLSWLIHIPAQIVTVPLILIKENPFIQIGPGLLLPESLDGGFLAAVLLYLNFFTIWQFVLISIGLAIVAGVSTKKTAGGVFTLLIIYALGVGAIMSISTGTG